MSMINRNRYIKSGSVVDVDKMIPFFHLRRWKMGYIIETNGYQNDIGWEIKMLYGVIREYMTSRRTFKVLTSSKEYNVELPEDIFITLCTFLNLNTLLKLALLNKSECSVSLVGPIADRFIDMMVSDNPMTKTPPTSISTYYDSIARSRIVTHEYFLNRNQWRMLKMGVVKNEELIMNYHKFFYNIGYLTQKIKMTAIGQHLVKNLDPQQFLDMYQELDNGDFNIFHDYIRSEKRSDYNHYLCHTDKIYNFKYIAEFIVSLNNIELIIKYKDAVSKHYMETKDLKWYDSNQIADIYGIEKAVCMYGSISNFTENTHDMPGFMKACSYLNDHSNKQYHIKRCLDIISVEISLDHAEDEEFAECFRSKFKQLRTCFKNKKMIDEYVDHILKEYNG